MAGQLLANSLILGCHYSLPTLGFALIYNATRTFHVAHGAIFTLSGYIFYLGFNTLGINPFIAIALTTLFGALLGLLSEWLVYGPLYKKGASSLVGFISSLGLYFAVVNMVSLLFGDDTRTIQTGLGAPLGNDSFVLTRAQIMQGIVGITIIPLFLGLLAFTRLGRMTRAMCDNPELAVVVGINIRLLRIIVFASGSGLAAISASLQMLDIGTDPNAGMPILLVSAVALIAGGVGTFSGPVLGAFLLAFIQTFAIWYTSVRWSDPITFGILVMFLLFRPQGILGVRRRIEEDRS